MIKRYRSICTTDKLISALALALFLSTGLAFVSQAAANVFSALLLLVFLILCWQSKKSGALPFAREYKSYAVVVLIFLICFLPGEIASLNPSLSLEKYFVRHILRWLPFFAVIFFLNNRQALIKKFLSVFVIATCLECAASALWVLLGISERSLFGAGPLDLPAEICFLTPIVCVTFLDKRIELKQKRFMPLILIIFIAGLIACASRGGWLVFALTAALSVLPYSRAHWKAFAACFISFLILMASIYATTDNASLRHRIGSIFKLGFTSYTDLYKGCDPFYSFHARIAAWISGVKIWQDHPFLGIGSGQWREYYHNKKYQLGYVEIPQRAVDRAVRKKQLEQSLATEIKRSGSENNSKVKKIKEELQRISSPLSLSSRNDRPARNIPKDIKLNTIRERFVYWPADSLPHTHNNYLQVLVEHGVIGLVGFLFLCLYFFKSAFTDWLATKNPYLWIFICSWISFLLTGAYDFFLNFYAYTRTVSTVAAILLVLAATKTAPQDDNALIDTNRE